MVTPVTLPMSRSGSRLAVEVAELYPLQGQWTEQDYFALPETNRHLELADGELLMPPHPTDTHQRIVFDLAMLLWRFVEDHHLGIVRIAPLPVRLWPGKIREPDVLFMAHAHSDRMSEQFFGPPDLVMEVTSPSTRQTDRMEKAIEYARAEIPEYWIIDPESQTVEVFVLRAGAYEMLGKWGKEAIARSTLLDGFQVQVSTLFPSP
jgi:Uma2 family endonuclease